MKAREYSVCLVHLELIMMDPTQKMGAKLQQMDVKTFTVLGILIDMMYIIGLHLLIQKHIRGIRHTRRGSKIFWKK